MSTTEQNITFFSGRERPSIKWIELPPDLTAWAEKNHELVKRVQDALVDTHHDLTDEQIWETIAANCSPEWVEAKAGLQKAEMKIADLNSPDNESLGPIGRALDSDENGEAHEKLAFSLSHFTIINEGLRQREDLSRLLSVLLVQKRMLERSMAGTLGTLRATASLDFAKASAKDQKPATSSPAIRLAEAFTKGAGKLLKKATSSTPSRNATVPSSPKA